MLKSHEIVKVWEISVGKALWEKGILMLSPLFAEAEFRQLATLSLGRRNSHLFRLREQLFGTLLSATSRCPECSEAVEFQLNTRIICDPARVATDALEFELKADDYAIVHRAVNSLDLQAVMPLLEVEGPEAAEWELFSRCVLSVSQNGVPLSVDDLPEAAFEALAESLKTNDPHSEIICRLNCPTCSHSWPEAFDIAKFFWHELEMKAHLILQDVQALAKAFGWWEGDILSLSDVRRQYYLNAIHD